MDRGRFSGINPGRRIYKPQDLVLSERLTDTSSGAVYMTKGDGGRMAEINRLKEEAEKELGASAVELAGTEIDRPRDENDD